jgi:hypothetical protein
MAKSRMQKGQDDGLSAVHGMVSEFSERLSAFLKSKNGILPALSDVLIELLNGNVLTAARKERVERIIELLRFVKGYRSQVIARLRSQDEIAADLYVTSLIDCTLELNESLSKYRVIPQIDAAAPSPALCFVSAEPGCDTAENRAEIGAVMCAVQLAQRDQVDDVRKCLCGMFFVARRIDQHYCSVKCRVKAHQSSDDFKAKRRKADRDRYRLHQRGKVKERTRRKRGTQKAR